MNPLWVLVTLTVGAIAYRLGSSRRADSGSGRPAAVAAPYMFATTYPVFCEWDVVAANQRAVEASRRAAQLWRNVVESARFKECCQPGIFTAEVKADMLASVAALIESERLWFRHAAYMDANLQAITGKMSREEAYGEAMSRLKVFEAEVLPHLTAERLRDEWVARYTDGTVNNFAVRPYSNIWDEQARATFGGF